MSAARSAKASLRLHPTPYEALRPSHPYTVAALHLRVLLMWEQVVMEGLCVFYNFVQLVIVSEPHRE